MKILNKTYSLLLLTSLFLMGCSDLMYDTFLVYPFKKGELVRKELASYTIDGENYLYIEEEVIRKGVANEKIDRLDYSLVNTRTNKKTTMPNDLYILTKKGLVKANFSIDDTFDYIASNRPIMYNGAFYILIMRQHISDQSKSKKDILTDCKASFQARPFLYNNKNAEVYRYDYIVRFDKNNGRFILDGAVDWKKEQTFKKKDENQRYYYEKSAMIQSYQQFDCR